MCSSANHVSSVCHAIVCSTVSRPSLDDPHRNRPAPRRRRRRRHVLWLYLYPSATCDVNRQNTHGARRYTARDCGGVLMFDARLGLMPKRKIHLSLRIINYHLGLNAVDSCIATIYL
jgi:hypothetical protein